MALRSMKIVGPLVTGVVGAVALIAAVLVPMVMASASSGASSPPLVTAAPDLRTATLDKTGLVHFCFDDAIAKIDPTQLFLVGYDSADFTTATSADVDPAD